VPSFPLHEVQGVVWVWMGAAEKHAPPEPAMPPGGGTVRRLLLDPELIDAPYVVVVESAFDRAHVPFIHRGTFGPDQDPIVTRQRITVDADGLGLRAEDDPDSPWLSRKGLRQGWIARAGRLLGLREPVSRHVRLDVRGTVQIFQQYPNGT